MAFHQPTTRHALQRVVRAAPEDAATAAVIETSSPLEESQTWVLFSPATDTATTTSYISSVHDSQQTAGRSRISDLGSLNTLPRSDVHSHAGELAAEPMEEDAGDEDAELDSLDSHLPDFRSVPHSQHHQVHASATVLPRHDGLGSFRLDTAGIATDMQEHMYAFERYNPQRKPGHDAGINLAELELEMDQDRIQQMERIQRIEAWRLEQSKLLLDEIQKQTRRRRQQTAGSVRESRSDSTVTEAVMTPAPTDDTMQGTEWHDQDAPHDLGVEEGLWSRITRKLIRDIMGIDDRMLGILFGEELVVEDDLSSTPKASELSAGNNRNHSDPMWQLRMLERASQELGMLVHQMSAHPGAFSTYMRVQQMPLPYAGLPVIPETTVEADEPAARTMGESAATTASPQFHPTIGKAAQAMNIPGRREAASAATSAHVPGNFTQHEWEQELDIKLVFRQPRRGDAPPPPPLPPPPPPQARVELREPEHTAVGGDEEEQPVWVAALVAPLLGYRGVDRDGVDDYGSRHGNHLCELILALASSQSHISQWTGFPCAATTRIPAIEPKAVGKNPARLKTYMQVLAEKGFILGMDNPFCERDFPIISLPDRPGVPGWTRRTREAHAQDGIESPPLPTRTPTPTPHAIQDFGRRGVNSFSSNGHPPACQPRQGSSQALL
ncbi:uncharacterized protein E0L32_002369 [Thyridium curvatum]|uniref:Uncharacterized protein n=1 Tax=Thyridium curvatum TaxID=1093900 RepID=A0A507AIB6_9PEZI|nr:uncharacterized protein E0L32_002369 [Thyridium curvatum]TPX06873.1 hypothetical protein E0L32_002369 [Thyridium curvatum]